jgi:hypothetical protein
LGPGGNFCSCPDYATAELGTCKHIEFTLARLEKKRGAKTAFARGYRPAFSELYLRNDGKRRVHFHAGTDCPAAVSEAAAGLFDAEHNGVLPDESLGALEDFMAMVAKSGHELRAYDDAPDFVAGRRDADRRASTLEQLFPGGVADPKLLALLKIPLYPCFPGRPRGRLGQWPDHSRQWRHVLSGLRSIARSPFIMRQV